MALDGSSRSRVKWRKVLYAKQPFPDNHVDETFLMGLKTNAHVKDYEYFSLLFHSTSITQQLIIVVLFVLVFVYTLKGTFAAQTLLSLSIAWMFFLLGARQFLDTDLLGYRTFWREAGSLALAAACLLGLSPLLQTLTVSFSDDTIYAMTTVLLLLHLCAFNPGNQLPNRFTNPISLNAAIFASVMMGSRLCSSLHVFALMTLSIELFALFPFVGCLIKNWSRRAHVSLTLLLMVAVFALLLPVSRALAVFLFLSILFITFVCPLWLIWLQKYKNQTNGPWDEAVVVVSALWDS